MQVYNPKISIIVPTRNSAHTLGACLKLIQEQTYKNIETIVVDNQSTDDTVSIAKKYTDKVYTNGPERSAQRNFGASVSCGEYLCFIDSDMEIGSVCIEEFVESLKKFEQKEKVVGIITEESFGVGFLAKVKKMERSFYIGNDEIEAPRIYSAHIFRQVGGYDEGLTGGEDWDLYDRVKGLGVRVYRTKDRILHNEGELDIDTIIRKRFLYGKAFRKYVQKKSNRSNMKGRGIIQRMNIFLCHWRDGLKDPLVYLGVFFAKVIEFWAAFLGMMVGYIRK